MSPCTTRELTVSFDASLGWEESLRRGAPETPEDYAVWCVASDTKRFLASMDGERKIVLLKFDRSLTSKEVDVCALGQGLTPLFPPELWQLSAQHPDLPTQLGLQALGLAALQPFTYNDGRMAATLWWYRTQAGLFERTAHVANYCGAWSKDYWFAYIPIEK